MKRRIDKILEMPEEVYSNIPKLTVTGFNEIPLVGVIKASAAGSTNTGALVKEAQLQGTQAYETLELDYTAWVARKNDTVIPTVFVNWIVPASETVAKPAE